MSKPIEEKSNALTLPEKLRAYVPWIFAGIILLGYAYFIHYLIGKTGAKDEEWVKITYIFSSVEAIVFTAVGFIFGREVNRSRAVKAEKNEEKAKKDKKELAKEVLKKLPQPPPNPDAFNLESQDLNKLRNMAEIYLND